MRILRTLVRASLGLVAAALIRSRPRARWTTVITGTVGSPSANLWPVFIGLDKGFFAAENVKIDLIYVQASAAVIQQLAAGSLNMTMSTGLVDPIRATDQGAAIAIARFEVQAPPYVMMAKAGIKSLAALKGKVISVGGAKDITRIYAERMLAPHGVKPGEYDFVYAGATTARAQALLGGAVDAATCCRRPISRSRCAGYNNLGPDDRICAGAGVLGHGGEQGLGRPQSARAPPRAVPRRARASSTSTTTATAPSWFAFSSPSAARSRKTSRSPTISSARTAFLIAPARSRGPR